MITILKAKKDDLRGLAALLAQFSAKTGDLTVMDKVFQKIENDPGYLLLVAKDSHDRVLGTAMGILCQDLAAPCQPFLLIENLLVDKNYRRQGIAKILMSSLESFARENHCASIVPLAAPESEEARQFSSALGFSGDKLGVCKKDLR